MKTHGKKVGLGVIVSMFFMVSFMVQASDTNFGTFKIEKASENLVVNNVTVETYTIEYSNMDKLVYVMIVPNKKSVHYIVRTDDFELQYLCKDDKFGVAYLNSEFATMDKQDVERKINRANFLYQKVICRGEQSHDYRLSLIANYLPEVYIAG